MQKMETEVCGFRFGMVKLQRPTEYRYTRAALCFRFGMVKLQQTRI